MEHVAIDLGKDQSKICLRDGQGTILEETKVATWKIGEYLKDHPGKKRVVLETCAEAFDVADEVLALGHEPVVVPATLAKALGVGQHGVKTDRRDAQALSKASVRMDLESVHIPSRESRERKSSCGMRDGLVSSRTKLVNNVRGYLRSKRISIKAGTAASLVKKVRAVLSERPEGLPVALDRQLIGIESLNHLIADADKELRAIAEADEDCQILMTMPGVGSITSIRFLASIDEPARFPNGHKMQSYLGMTPGERSSSERKRMTGITKAGPSALRWVLIQAAWSLWRTRPNDPMVLWAMRIAQRRSKPVAIVALGRKMISVLRAMLRDRTEYNPLSPCKPRLQNLPSRKAA
jgi:transposase